jgi:hypothetical protein
MNWPYLLGRHVDRGLGSAVISGPLNDAGHSTGRRCRWTPSRVLEILWNPTYAGRLPFNGEAHQAQHAPLVDAEVFARAQRIVAEREQSWRDRARRMRKGPCCICCELAQSSQTGVMRTRRFRPPPRTVCLRWLLLPARGDRPLGALVPALRAVVPRCRGAPAERGVEVDHVTVYRWVQRFMPLLAEAARPCRHSVGDRWQVDETYVKVAGRWRYVYRAIDQFGQVIDVFVSPRRDGTAARRFFERAIGTTRVKPIEVTTGQRRIRRCSMTCCRRRGIGPTSTTTTASNATTGG